MAWVAHVVSAEAVEKGDGAAVHAFPVDLCLSMFGTVSVPNAQLLRSAVLAEKVFRLCITLFGIVHLLLTVDQSSKVWLFARVALVEGAAMHSELLRFVVVKISRCR